MCTTLQPAYIEASILKGLPRDYQPFVVVLTTMQKSVTLDALYTMLMDAETQLACFGESLEPFPMSAHMVEGKVSGGFEDQSDSRSSSRQSYSCGRFSSRGRGQTRLQCQLCGKNRYLVDQCWHRFDENFPGVTANSNSYSKDDSSVAYYSVNDNKSTGCATHHVTSDGVNISQSVDLDNPGKLLVGNGVASEVEFVGYASLNSSSRLLLLTDLLHAPQITKNLLSVSKLARDNNVFLEFHSHECFVHDEKSGAVLLRS
ncbi:uncharacterized protein LOC120140005 [Hibiscus syriacus]|uniref:uncharacterized protein LOC120140005 n=1 Tax=Hibiscus syriacus TaxID=106335 RepID=UPI001924E213|nr:uncharacterized protein LOC120140005 [Hibiscus syriacus]